MSVYCSGTKEEMTNLRVRCKHFNVSLQYPLVIHTFSAACHLELCSSRSCVLCRMSQWNSRSSYRQNIELIWPNAIGWSKDMCTRPSRLWLNQPAARWKDVRKRKHCVWSQSKQVGFDLLERPLQSQQGAARHCHNDDEGVVPCSRVFWHQLDHTVPVLFSHTSLVLTTKAWIFLQPLQLVKNCSLKIWKSSNGPCLSSI